MVNIHISKSELGDDDFSEPTIVLKSGPVMEHLSGSLDKLFSFFSSSENAKMNKGVKMFVFPIVENMIRVNLKKNKIDKCYLIVNYEYGDKQNSAIIQIGEQCDIFTKFTIDIKIK